MKNLIFLKSTAFLLGLLLTSCESDDNHPNPCYSNNCDIITEERFTSEFTGISNNFVGSVFVTQGEDYSITVSGKDYWVRRTRTEVIDGQLVVKFDSEIINIPGGTSMVVRVTAPFIDDLQMNGVGKLITENIITSPDLSLQFSGVGSMKVKYSGDNASVTHSGVGNLLLEGSAHTLGIIFSGIGNIDAFGFESNVCNINHSSLSTCSVTVNDELDVTITNIGSVIYRGDPIVTSRITGSGALKHQD